MKKTEGIKKTGVLTGGTIPDDVVKQSLMYKENQAFIRELKARSYTFTDLGDPLNIPQKSVFYDMGKPELY